MSGHRAPDQPLVRLSFRGRLLLASLILGTLLLATGGVALGAALGGGQVTCQTGADLLVHPDGTWTCGATPSTSPSATPSPSSSPTPTPTPSPSPTPTPTPSPSPSTTAPGTTPPGPQTNCVAAPGKCGYPDASTTGPTGSLTVSTKTVYTSAATVTNTEIRGCVEVRAAVVFRNVRFTGACFWTVRVYSGSAVIEDSEITCQDTPGSSGFVSYSGATVASTLRKVNIHNCENGLSVQGNVAVVDSWIHGLYDGSGAHSDGAQFDEGASNITFSHDTIDARGNTSSAVTSWDEAGAQNANVTFDRNFFMGGAISLRCGRQGAIVNVVITNNRFIGGVWVNGDFVSDPGGPTYDTSNSCNRGQVWSGNVRDLTGAALAAD